MASSHRLPPPGTCHTEFSMQNKGTYQEIGPTMNQEVGGKGQAKGTELHKARPPGQN